MDFRTDLALERRESLGEGALNGVVSSVEEKSGVRVTRIEITDIKGENALGKPMGKYITVEVPPLTHNSLLDDGSAQTVAQELTALLPQQGDVLVAGLGNTNITPDALGPKCASMIFATRHIGRELAESTGLGNLRGVAVSATGVLGSTGMETAEVIAGLASRLKPAAVITVDALAARKVSRLGCTVQMCDTGIVPGSGVGNSRQAINRQLIGVPVISIGVPTVVDAATLVADIGGDGSRADEQESKMMVTPREIDLVIERAAKLVSLAINCSLQPHIAPEDMLMLTADG